MTRGVWVRTQEYREKVSALKRGSKYVWRKNRGTHKYCDGCKQHLPIEKFRVVRKRGGSEYFTHKCASCKREDQRLYRESHKERLRKNARLGYHRRNDVERYRLRNKLYNLMRYQSNPNVGLRMFLSGQAKKHLGCALHQTQLSGLTYLFYRRLVQLKLIDKMDNAHWWMARFDDDPEEAMLALLKEKKVYWNPLKY